MKVKVQHACTCTLTEKDGWYTVKRNNTATCVCLSQSGTWISIGLYRGFVCVQWALCER